MPTDKNYLVRFLRWTLVTGVCFVLVAVGSLYLLCAYLSPRLPSIEVLRDIRLQVPLRVYSSEGGIITEFGEKRRDPIQIEDIPLQLKNAYLAAEDDRFYEHPGVDYHGLLRAAVSLIRTGRKTQGGSTITMQVARNFFLSREKTFLRKFNEILLALKIEKAMSKDHILALYLNKIFLGNRAYGVGAAANVYYGTSLQELTLAQMAMIAGLPKRPSAYNPINNPERALVRRNYVLNRMLELDMIDRQEYERARSEGVSARLHNVVQTVDAGHIGEMVRAYMVELYGDRAYTDGMRVYTTVQSARQADANRALRKALLGYEERRGYRGAAGTVAADILQDAGMMEQALADYADYGGLVPAIVVESDAEQALLYVRGGGQAAVLSADIRWAGPRRERGKGPAPKEVSSVLAAGDVVYALVSDDMVRLAQMPTIEGALVALRPDDGAITALVGGFDFQRSKFNRVMQAERQPGSNFKPFIYSAALENGYTAASIINDAPVVFETSTLEGAWRPENYSGRFYGPTRLREALVKSRNLVSIRLLIAMGLPYTINYIERFGFAGNTLPNDLSLALGSGTLKPIEVATAYAVFANNGYLVTPYFINRIEDVNGNILFQANPARACPDCTDQPAAQEETLENYAKRVVDRRNAYIMRSILRDVVQRGTARKARVLGRRDLGGKTGTTNEQRDAWFSGFNNEVVATAWVGYDQNTPLGARETGGRAALPIWIDYMRAALQDIPEDERSEPEGMVSILIDPETGDLANADDSEAIFEIFRAENAPGPNTAAGGASKKRERRQQEAITEQIF